MDAVTIFDEENAQLTRGQFLAGGAALAAAGFLSACGGGSTTTTSGGSTAGKPRPGGNLRVGLTGAGPTETIDAMKATSNIDQARLYNLYARLVARDPNTKLVNQLAESFEPNADATVWTVRLIDGAEFHNGKTISADDVIYTIRRVFAVKGNTLARLEPFVDPKTLKKIDARTVRIPLKKPNALLTEAFFASEAGIIPVGYDPKKPIGSGPFKYRSFTPGQESVFTKFDNYFGDGPYVDTVRIISFKDDSSRVNAMLSGQVDAIDVVPYGQIPVVQQNGKTNLLEADSGATLIFTMRTDTPPYDDVRVRQAMRLLVNRQQMINQAIAGKGKVANDLFARFDPCYDKSIPQREQDVEQAKTLLRQAGALNTTFELVAGPAQAGLVEASQVLVEQAKGAGVNIKLRTLDLDGYFGGFLKWPFSVDYWDVSPYYAQVALNQLNTAPFNATHFDNKQYNALWNKGVAQTSEDARCSIAKQMQQIEHEQGGNIVWTWREIIDAYGKNVQGFVPDKNGLSLGGYAFWKNWFST